jgi:hypothetical protein
MPQTRSGLTNYIIKLFAEPIGSATTSDLQYLPVPLANWHVQFGQTKSNELASTEYL